MDVNTERADDVLLHQKLLKQAEIPENRPTLLVRDVCVSAIPSSILLINLHLYDPDDWGEQLYECIFKKHLRDTFPVMTKLNPKHLGS